MARCIGSFNVSRIETCQPGQPSPVGVWQDFSRLDQKSVPSTPEWGRAYSPAEDRLPFWLSVRVVKCLKPTPKEFKKTKKGENQCKKTNIPLFEKSKNKSKTKPNDYFQKANKSKRKQKTNWIYIYMRLLFFLFFGTLFFFDCFFVFFLSQVT
jgi:hypothetical protein